MRRVPLSAAVAVSGLLSACTEDPRREANVFRYFTPAHVDTIDPRAIELTEEIFGVELVEHSEAWGAVAVFPFDRDDFDGAFDGEFDVNGQAHIGRCTPWIWYVTDSPLALAHEMGHAYGLAHVDTPCNIMLPELSCEDGSYEVTDEQIRTVREESWDQEEVCEILSKSQ